MQRLAFILFVAIFVSGCGGVRSQAASPETMSQVAVDVHKSNLSDKDKQAFDEAKERSDNGDYDSTGKSVGQVIDEQEAFDADKKAQQDKADELARELQIKHDDLVRSLQNALTVAAVSKSYEPADYMNDDYQARIAISFALRNNSPKSVRAFKGTTTFNTLVGDEVYTTNLDTALTIPPYSIRTWDGSIDYNEFDASLRRLKDADLHDLKMTWTPKTILYTDGSKLEVTQ